jgi:murein tripeptide amidase MpaA
LKQTAIKLQDFDVYLPESKRVEFELVNTILDAATELTKLKTNYFDVRILAGSLHTKVVNKVVAGEFTNTWEIKKDAWKE